MKICVVGLGNIGSNLYAFLKDKFPGQVTGVDIKADRVENLKQQDNDVVSDYSLLTDIDIWLMALSTGNRGQNLFAALDEMDIRPGSLISIESTLPLGTMDRVKSYLEERGFTLGEDIFLITIPHRIMFGVDKTVCDTPRVMGAYTPSCLEKGRDFYASLVPELVEVKDIRVAELSKVVENVKRYVDVAFAQELYRYCIEHGLDFVELQRAVNSKANVKLLDSDWGIGGECLPKDMGFLQAAFPSPLLKGASEADALYREEIVARVGTGKKVLLSGVSFKDGVKDLEHSRGVDLARALEAKGNTVWVEDPLFSADELTEWGLSPYQDQDYSVAIKRSRALNPHFY